MAHRVRASVLQSRARTRPHGLVRPWNRAGLPVAQILPICCCSGRAYPANSEYGRRPRWAMSIRAAPCCTCPTCRISTHGQDGRYSRPVGPCSADPPNAFQLLVEHEPDGVPAREIARRLALPHNTMSTHLAILTGAGLIGVSRDESAPDGKSPAEYVSSISQGDPAASPRPWTRAPLTWTCLSGLCARESANLPGWRL